GTTYGTAHARSALVANSIVMTACSPWVPPAALISPTTVSCRNGGSRAPSTCSQSSAFLKAPEIVPWYIGLLPSIPLAAYQDSLRRSAGAVGSASSSELYIGRSSSRRSSSVVSAPA